MSRARLSSKSQIVVPADVRRRLGLRPGDEVVFESEDERVVLRKAPASTVERLEAFAGEIWRGYADEVRRERDEWDR